MTQVAERISPVPVRSRPGAGALLASRRWRIFLTAWILYSVHFATNVVREHYPAFSIAEHGTFRVDEYQGFHADIFVHTDGHSVIGNQVLVSVLAAVPLFVFDPVLDALERYSRRRLATEGVGHAEYRTDKPNRVAFYRLVKERGLELRFGAATVITSVLFMAPLTALFLVFVYDVLVGRGMRRADATWLTLLFGFGTPLFFRTSHLNHNLFVMYAMFISYVLLWRHSGTAVPVRTRLLAGLFAGITLATDYVGIIILPLLYGYLLLDRRRTASWTTSLRESLVFVAGAIPPVLFLLYSQWAMYGNPFLPGQHWMPQQNQYTEIGMRGMSLPAPDLIFMNLFHPGYGLFLWAPLFVLSFLPVREQGSGTILPRREWLFVMTWFVALLLFSSANQYARLQWNSGFRYLVPALPFLLLAMADRWVRLSRAARIGIAALVVTNSWVLTVFREPVHESWRLFLAEGIQLPWLRVLRMTSPAPGTWLSGQLPALAVLTGTLLLIGWLWRRGAGLEARRRAADVTL
ncbi:MAG TPA: hypothetical protein VFZ24_15725 [Longimicrobiales bacterium]